MDCKDRGIRIFAAAQGVQTEGFRYKAFRLKAEGNKETYNKTLFLIRRLF